MNSKHPPYFPLSRRARLWISSPILFGLPVLALVLPPVGWEPMLALGIVVWTGLIVLLVDLWKRPDMRATRAFWTALLILVPVSWYFYWALYLLGGGTGGGCNENG